MRNINLTVAAYIGAWNERDDARRKALVAETWAQDGTYRDAHRAGVGHDQISEMIGTAQKRFPGYALRLVSGIEAHSGHVRFSWAAGGAPDAPLFIAGADFASTDESGLFTSVIGFSDAAPAPMA